MARRRKQDGPERFNAALEPLARSVRGLRTDAQNARRHDERSVASIAASLERFGQQKPIVVAGGTVVAGNGTLMAAKQLGWKRIAAVQFDDEQDAARAFALVDNRTAELSEWDYVALKNAVEEVTAKGVDMAALRLDELLAASPAVGAFLDEYEALDPDAKRHTFETELPPELRDDGQHVNFSCALEAEDHRTVWEALVQAREGTATVVEAMLSICRWYVEQRGGALDKLELR
ncbi:MAG: hypothetical protein GF393_01600 [Armatimonadia bacterium]|nr:hypothetical protein [Armatimonadia bacterium]